MSDDNQATSAPLLRRIAELETENKRLHHEWEMFMEFGILPSRYIKWDKDYTAEFNRRDPEREPQG